MIEKIPVKSKDGIKDWAIVDAEDADRVLRFSWFLLGKRYVQTHWKGPDGRATSMRLHRFIMNAPAGMDVDHINGNGLDNRKCNLRICTHAQNMMNHRGYSPSGVRGTRKMGNRWHARIHFEGREIHLGAYATREEAWMARRAAELKYRGEFASSA